MCFTQQYRDGGGGEDPQKLMDIIDADVEYQMSYLCMLDYLYGKQTDCIYSAEEIIIASVHYSRSQKVSILL